MKPRPELVPGMGQETFIASYISCYSTLMIELAKKEASM